MSIYEKDGKTVVRLNESKLTIMLRNAVEKDQRRQIIRNYLFQTIVGKVLSKELVDSVLLIKNTKTDVKHLTHNEHMDTSLALTLVEELINASEYIGEKPVDIKKEPKSPNDYYWYLKVTVEINNNEYEYVLNIGRSKTDKHLSLYDINNYNKRALTLTASQTRGTIRSFLMTLYQAKSKKAINR